MSDSQVKILERLFEPYRSLKKHGKDNINGSGFPEVTCALVEQWWMKKQSRWLKDLKFASKPRKTRDKLKIIIFPKYSLAN